MPGPGFLESIDLAKNSFEKLLTREEIRGKTFLDIGSGSGIHSLVALVNGASFVHAIDIDEHSVASTRETLNKFYFKTNYLAEKISILDEKFSFDKKYDIVYSWGVLHHTGAMLKAIEIASSLVDKNGKLVLALYSKTIFCNFWKVEKRVYTNSPEWFRFLLRNLYIASVRIQFFLTFRNFNRFIKTYKSKRGMSFFHDVHDWLGGYPYESISESKLTNLLLKIGFEKIRTIPYNGKIGFFGTGCFEVTFNKII